MKTLPERLKRQCKNLATATLVASIGLSCLLLLERTGHWLVDGVTPAEALQTALTLIAPGCFLFALWYVGKVMNAFAVEGRFVATAALALRGVGWAVLIGGSFQVLLAPSLQRAIGRPPGYIVDLDISSACLAVLGVFLILMARLFERIAKIEHELDGIV